uniref:Alcohol acetyltransferase ATF(B)4 n=1 Tax=Saccharomycopsis fibuligera TaxID=4944 RepID=A0A8F2EIZ1_SACFI|nr:alcohol acetyltransferase ATF(B)4 [Saccharomycopsis fibuligera]
MGNFQFSRNDFYTDPTFTEKCFYYYDQYGLISNFSVTIKTTASITRELLYAALKKVILKYPNLVSSIHDKFDYDTHNEKTLTKSPKKIIYFDDNIVQFISQDEETRNYADINQIQLLLNATKFDSNFTNGKPMWKIFVFPNKNLTSWVFDYSIFDGGSAIVYQKELVEALNQILESEQQKAREILDNASKRTTPILFDFEKDWPLFQRAPSQGIFKEINYVPSIFKKVSSQVIKLLSNAVPDKTIDELNDEANKSAFLERIIFEKEKLYLSKNVIGLESGAAKPLSKIININHIILSKILDKCHTKGCNFQAIFIIIFLATVHQVIPLQYSKKYLKTVTSASFRNIFTKQFVSHNEYLAEQELGIQKLLQGQQQFIDGIFVHSAIIYIEPFDEFSWELCHKYDSFLHTLLHSKGWFANYYVANRGIQAKAFVDNKLGSQDDVFVSFDNLGLVRVKESGKFQIEDIIFTKAPDPIAGDNLIAMVSTKKGGLNIQINIAEEHIQARFDEFCLRLSENLIALGNF